MKKSLAILAALVMVFAAATAVLAEEPAVPNADPEDGTDPSVPGSTAFVPAVAGLLLANEVVNDLIG